MGVPKLFHTLIQQYHHHAITNPTGYYIIKHKINNDLPSHFYLDFNGGIYQCIKPEIQTEETLILHVIEYLETLCSIIPNLELIYIAFDGVAPQGKIAQQRQRRFHSICRTNRSKKIIERFGTDIDKQKPHSPIDSNMFTPGTSFMYNLALAIKRTIQTGGTNGIFKNKTVILSDSSIPGEGEHKIIHHIKEFQNPSTTPTPHNTIIYALDNDLIFLSLSLHIDNTYLFRESDEYGKLASIHTGKKFLYMDVSELSEALITYFKDTYGCTKFDDTTSTKKRYIDDYIFLGMMLGNDFMPKCHWFSIAEGGFEKFLSAYWQIHNHTELFLVNTHAMTINTEMLCDLLYLIKEQEQSGVEMLLTKRKKAKIFIPHEATEKDRQQLLTDFYPLQHLYVEQQIDPFKPNWRDRYYKVCFHLAANPQNLKMITQAYLKTLVWNFHYYFDECISWDWDYPFAYSPTFSDIYNELLQQKNINVTSSNKIFHFPKSTPLEAQTVLLMVLPWASRKFMAQDIQRKLALETCPLRIYFPKRYALNVAFHRYYYECTSIIYKMDKTKVQKFMNECKLTEDELKRNVVSKPFIIIPPSPTTTLSNQPIDN
jgi:5'-3' exonuclease